ncbi:MAG: kinase/pyrophosphorylase [Acidobacteria bacterium]|jgi:hypothetical protein|nr:kinase/pyrophosphorylase [Acidobacteriota bacterium]
MNNTNKNNKRHIFILSDSTGKTAEQVVDAALQQFVTTQVVKKIYSNVRTSQKIQEIIDEAANVNGIVIFTLVTPNARQQITEMGRFQGVPTIDLLGPLLSRFSDLLEISPLAQPGLGRQLDDDYFKRIESIEFAIQHDDGLRLDTIDQAEIILLGVSRTMKTPVSIYLSYRGWKVANVPILNNQPLPKELACIEPGRIIALTVSPTRLQLIRLERKKHLKNVELGDYTDMHYIKEEVAYALQLYRDLNCEVLDVTYKSIEEVSTEIMRTIYAHSGMKKGKIC